MSQSNLILQSHATDSKLTAGYQAGHLMALAYFDCFAGAAAT